MKLLNIRHGFATNSSSSHSVILMDHEPSVSDNPDSFGWDHFTVSSPMVKARYLGATLHANLTQLMSEDLARAVVDAWCPGAFSDGEDEIPNVDHQSVIGIPFDFIPWINTRAAISKSFFQDLQKYLMNPYIAILGGNDNSDECHPMLCQGKRVLEELPRDENSGAEICRKDGDWWTLFNKRTGKRTTFSFEDNPPPITKFDTPLLVDLKITDFCDMGCSFCYQDSRPTGEHAKVDTISSYFYELAAMKVFEVAIGGGEPTKHPQFAQILRLAKQSGIVPNFTTRNLSWVTDDSEGGIVLRTAIKECVGAIAYSVSTPEDVKLFVETLRPIGLAGYGNHSAIHVIPELLDEDTFTAIAREANRFWIQMTLLGLKRTGRGQYAEANRYNWLDILLDLKAEHHCPQVAVDTSLARNNQVQLTRLDPTKASWFTDEGGRSMYIDAVKELAAPSSYSSPMSAVSLQRLRYGGLKEVFQALPIER